MLLIVGGAIYAGVIFIPVWADNFDVKEALAAAYNSASREPDEALRAKIRWMLRNTGTHKEDDGYGNIVVKPGLGISDEDIVIERNGVTNTISISLDYRREVRLKPTKKTVTLNFSESRQGPLEP